MERQRSSFAHSLCKFRTLNFSYPLHPLVDYLFHSLLCHMANPASDIIAAKRAHEKCVFDAHSSTAFLSNCKLQGTSIWTPRFRTRASASWWPSCCRQWKMPMPTRSPRTSLSSTGLSTLCQYLQPQTPNHFRSMSRLDKWRTTLLLTIKKKIGEQDFS